MLKENKEERTFETRLKFLASIFNDVYSKDKIMTSCISFKLDRAYKEYLRDVHQGYWYLVEKDPLAVLKKID